MSPLIALPILAHAVSVGTWSAIAIGQSVGGLGATIASVGWNIVGPSLVARSSSEAGRLAILHESFESRLVATALTAPIAFLAAAAIPADSAPILAGSVAVASTVASLTIVWFSVGVGSPTLAALTWTLPTAGSTIGAALIVRLSGEPWVYPIGITSGVLLPQLAVAVRTAKRLGRGYSLGSAVASIRRNAYVTYTETSASAYSMGANALVGLTASTLAVAQFNSGYRLATLGAVVIGTVANTLRGWAAAPRISVYRHRVRIAFVAHCLIGALGGIGLAVLGPFLSRILFGPALEASAALMLPLGVFFLLWSVETVTSRYILADEMRGLTLLWTTSAGSAAGIPAIIVASGRFGAVGAAWSLAAAMCLIVLLQLAACAETLIGVEWGPISASGESRRLSANHRGRGHTVQRHTAETGHTTYQCSCGRTWSRPAAESDYLEPKSSPGRPGTGQSLGRRRVVERRRRVWAMGLRRAWALGGRQAGRRRRRG